ncbi:MAG TPA: PDZ domain-containing protein [Longimicrobiales bacterium]|nr:PDZ domain-containing protein [Longimicrobiales bacterium]
MTWNPLTNRRAVLLVALLGMLIPVVAHGQADAPTRLLRQPALSATHIAFMYGNDIWVTPRTGGDARRITSFPGEETSPYFSPDGRHIAFSAQYGGNTDVWTVPVEGGEPTRLTWHPGADVVRGWTPDGRRVVFASGRTNAPSGQKFWTVGLDGALPQALPMPRAHQGQFSPDGRRFAYRMVSPWEDEWRNYRGGQNRPVWILDMQSHDLEEVTPWDGSNDGDPVWIGETVYFLSDRDFATNIWGYDTRTKQLRQVTRYTDFDVKTLNTDGRTLVFEQAGYVHTLDPNGGTAQRVDIRVRGDFAWLMPQWKDISANALRNPALSPNGRRAVFEARGEIITVPAEKGDWRNLTNTSGVAERSPSWSPDGKSISYFSDAGGEYSLVIAEQDGLAEPRTIALPTPAFQFTPAWSPDSKKILFTDTHLRLWIVDVASGRATHADTDTYMAPERSMNPVWSPDSRWVAYAKRLPSQFHAIYVYDTQEGRVHQLTDGLSDATWPAWDASGKYMYFLASTNFALNTGWLDMSSYERPVTRAVYLAVLDKDDPSPLLPESDEEAVRADSARAGGAGAGAGTTPAGAGASARVPTVTIDVDGFMQRVVSINVPARDYSQLRAGAAGTVFFLEAAPGPGGSATLQRYVTKEREVKPFATGVQGYVVSTDGKKMLYRAGQNWSIVDTDKAAPAATAGRLALANMRVRVDPRQEFRQMFDEGWRFQRDFLYVPNMHGADYVRTKALYEPLVEHVAHRSDLTYLLDWMGGEVAIGHSFVRGGDAPSVPSVNVGLLGADLEVSNGRYRIAKIYTGENWNPELRAPLSGPGINVNVGDYLLEVNGVDVRAPANPYQYFENLANRQTVIRVGPNANGQGSRVVTVVPVANEGQLRQRDWIEGNRRKVDELSGGRLAYVWVPNTGQGGYTYFNRYYFAQQDKQGAIVDERFNSGGSAADYIVDVLNRQLHGYFNNAVGERTPFTSPGAGIWGPKVMIINEMAGSGGDLMPYIFRHLKVGTLVGKRTWGGLVGTWDTPPLIDGGTMIAPRGGFFDADGNWAVENEGVAPDIDVEMTPKDVIAGRDPQLERAVQEALRLLRENPVELKKEPAPPVRWRRPGGQ